MSPTTRSRRTGAAGMVAILAGLLFVLVAAIPASAQEAEPQAVINATLKAAHQGATNPGFSVGSCPTDTNTGFTYGWHFVLPGNVTSFVTVTAEFENQGVVTDFISFPTGKHAYVYTEGPDTLINATATVDGTQAVFNLSHVCPGTTPPTTPPTVPPTVAPTTQATVAPTTGPTVADSTVDTAAVGGITQTPTTQAGTLPRTGSSTTLLFVMGASLVAGGLLLVAAARRRLVS